MTCASGMLSLCKRDTFINGIDPISYICFSGISNLSFPVSIHLITEKGSI
jgi:hypothetical protein